MLELDGVVIKEYKKKGKEKNKTIYNPVNYTITDEKIDRLIFNNYWSNEVKTLKQNLDINSVYNYLTKTEIEQIVFLTKISNDISKYDKVKDFVTEIIVDETEKYFEHIDYLHQFRNIEFTLEEFENVFKQFGSKINYLKIIFQNIDDTQFMPINIDSDYDILKSTEFPTNWYACKPKYYYPNLINGLVMPFVDKSFVYKTTGWNIFQQIEFSTCQKHMCYYYRYARCGFKIDFDNLFKFILNYVNNYLVEFNNVEELISDCFYLNRYEIFEYIYNLETSDEKDVCFGIYRLVRVFFECLDSEYVFQKVKEIFLDITKDDINFELVETFDKDIFGNKIEDTHIVAKMGYNERGKKILLDISTVNKIGIDEILDNDIDFPIEDGIYYKETPNIIYFLPEENSISKNGVVSNTGKILKKFLKRTRILFKPEKYLSEKNDDVLVDGHFIVPEGRVLSGLPCLCFGHLVSEMSLKDKCFYLKKILK